MRSSLILGLLLCGCATNRFTVCTDAEARDIATATLNAHLAGKMWRGSDGVVHAYRTFSPSEWTTVRVESGVWRLIMREAKPRDGDFAVITVDRRTRRARIESRAY